jgi:hypothetical protein
MKLCDYLLGKIPNFENRLLFAQLLSPYDCNSDSKYGYLDASKELLETYKPTEELEEYINQYEIDNSPLDEYDKAYVQAYRDYIKQESLKKESVTNE